MDKTAEELVLEIKEKSELMVDLAYSSVLYDNKTLAKEVYELENAVDNLYYNLQKRALEDVKNQKHSIEDALTLLRIARAGEQIADAAQEIADVELRDVELHPILKESIQDSDVIFTRVVIEPISILCNKTLGELKLASETGMIIIAMRHENRWLYSPHKKTKIDPYDVLFAKGPEDSAQHLQDLAQGKTQEI
ncbi:MAG: PhoU family transcriptional regulator [Candidatus Thermoplasmatota archaeon]|nr:PhoU family transcriptional regulator [Candidatus Thermoplasmatota archaeon]MBU1940182.1 PhoU family transcriptional regulator [Candidatus Thermoplasmatota archaeon]